MKLRVPNEGCRPAVDEGRAEVTADALDDVGELGGGAGIRDVVQPHDRILPNAVSGPAGAPLIGPRVAGSAPCRNPKSPVTSSVTAKLDKKKSIILGVIGLAVIVLIFWKVIPQIGSYEDALVALEDMGVGAMIVIGISVVDLPDRLRLPVHGGHSRPAVLAVGAAEPGGLRHQQRRARRRRLRPGGAVRDARDLQDPRARWRRRPSLPSGLWSIFVSLGLPILGVLALSAVRRRPRSTPGRPCWAW